MLKIRKPRLSKRTIKWLLKGEYVESKDHQFTLTAPEGIWKFLKKGD